MARIDIRHRHGIAQQDAARRTRELFDDFASTRREVITRVDWNPAGNVAEVTGKGFSGRCEITDREVVVGMELSFLARPFKGRIEQGLRDRLAREFPA